MELASENGHVAWCLHATSTNHGAANLLQARNLGGQPVQAMIHGVRAGVGSKFPDRESTEQREGRGRDA